MDRFLLLVFTLLTLVATSHATMPPHDEHWALEIKTVEDLILADQSHLVSAHMVSKLMSQHHMWSQYFADPNISLDQKSAALSHSQSLSEVLKALGHDVISVESVPVESSRGSGSGVIRGFVRSATNESPLDGAQVSLYTSGGVFISSEYTDSIGRYIIDGLEAGEYVLLAEASNQYAPTLYDGVMCSGGLGFGCQASQASLVAVASDQVRDQINFELEKFGTVSGKVVDAQSGNGIYATITVYDASYNFVNSTNAGYSSGEFSAVIPGSGLHYLKISANNYRSKMYDDVACDGDACDLSQATGVQVDNDQNLDLGITDLDRYVGMSGYLVDVNTGEPVTSYGSVEILRADNNQYMGSSGTDGQRHWSVASIPPGSYHIRASANDYMAQYHEDENCDGHSFSSCDQVNPDTVQHDGTNPISGITFHLQPGAVIRGTIKDHDNNPVAAYVRLYSSTGNSIDYDYASDEGQYEFTGLADGTYYVSAANYNHLVTMHPNVLCTDVSYSERCNTPEEGNPIVIKALATAVKNVRMKQGGTLSGWVRDSNNNPISGASVSLTGDDNYYSTQTDSAGNYEISNIASDQYYLKGSSHEYASVVWSSHVCSEHNSCDLTQGNRIVVSGNNTINNRNLNLPKLGRVNVSFIDNTGQPVSGGSLYAYDMQGSQVGSSAIGSDGQGGIWLYPGQYRFMYRNYNGEYISKVYGGANCYDNCQSNNGSTIQLNLGQTRNLSMSLDRKFKIKGTITEAQPTGYSRKYVHVYHQNQLINSNTFYGTGEYEININHAGPIKVEVTQEGHFSQYFQGVNCYGNHCGLAQATSINVIPNQSKTMNFNLTILNHVKGRVRGHNGVPLAGIQVKTSRSGYYGGESAVTDSNGYYAFYGLTPGQHNIRAITDGEHESTLLGDVPCPTPCAYNEEHELAVGAGDYLNFQNINMSRRGSISIEGASYIAGGIAAGMQVAIVGQSNNEYHWHTTNQEGDIGPVFLPEDTYQVLARVGDYQNNLHTSYPDQLCQDTNVCLAASPEFQIDGQSTHVLNALQVHRKGSLRAEFFAEDTGLPVSSVELRILDSEMGLVRNDHASGGVSVIEDVDAGTYHIYARTHSSSPYMHQLYDGVSCGRGLGVDCLLTEGTTVDIQNNIEQTMTFDLLKKPVLTVNLMNAYSQQPVSGNVTLVDPSGSEITERSAGPAVDIPVNEGQYYVVGSAYRHSITAYPNGLCGLSDDINSCDMSQVSLIDVSATGGMVNLGLHLNQGINGQVTNGYTGAPMGDVVIDLWRHNGWLSESTISNSMGRFSVPLSSNYDYYLTTDIPTGMGLFNEVYNNRLCFDGPAIMDLCEPEIGDLIDVNSEGAPVPIMLIELHGDPVFTGGFEAP